MARYVTPPSCLRPDPPTRDRATRRNAARAATERIARRVGITPRPLQRRLRDERTSYRELVDAIRHHRALDLIRRGAPLGDIAEHLGFSEARAFRRWTGLVPSAIPRPA